MFHFVLQPEGGYGFFNNLSLLKYDLFNMVYVSTLHKMYSVQPLTTKVRSLQHDLGKYIHKVYCALKILVKVQPSILKFFKSQGYSLNTNTWISFHTNIRKTNGA